jgi:hypothetical protein
MMKNLTLTLLTSFLLFCQDAILSKDVDIELEISPIGMELYLNGDKQLNIERFMINENMEKIIVHYNYRLLNEFDQFNVKWEIKDPNGYYSSVDYSNYTINDLTWIFDNKSMQKIIIPYKISLEKSLTSYTWYYVASAVIIASSAYLLKSKNKEDDSFELGSPPKLPSNPLINFNFGFNF